MENNILAVKIVTPNYTTSGYVVSVFDGRKWEAVYQNEDPALALEVLTTITYKIHEQKNELLEQIIETYKKAWEALK